MNKLIKAAVYGAAFAIGFVTASYASAYFALKGIEREEKAAAYQRQDEFEDLAKRATND